MTETDAVIEELAALGASAPVLQAAAFLIAGAEIDQQTLAQRARRWRERQHRLKLQASRKPALKMQAITVFSCHCQYCNRQGQRSADPDGKPWALDRIKPGKFGGEYVASNVTLACERCNVQKGTNWPIRFRPKSVAEVAA